MIVRLGGRARAEGARRLHTAAVQIISSEANKGRSAGHRVHARAARPRLRDLSKATDALVPQLVAAVVAMRAPVSVAAAKVLTKSRENDANYNSLTNREAGGDEPVTQAELDRLLRAADDMTGDELEAALGKAMKSLYGKGIAHAKLEINAPGSWDAPASRALEALEQYALEFATDVTADEALAIKGLLHDAFREGVSIKNLSAQIAEYMDEGVHRLDRNGELVTVDLQSWSRAVARTEVARAQNAGTMAAYRQIGVAQIMWIAADDERTCPLCGGLDGVVVALGTNFPNTSVEIAPAHVQCRCTAVAVRNTDGTLVRDVPDETAA